MERHDWQQIIDRYYPAGSRLRDIYLLHCEAVARKALALARKTAPDLSEAEIEAAAMLHDIGIVATDAPSIECRGKLPYICHGIEGAAMLRRENAPEWVASVAERHTGAGLTADEILRESLPLPAVDLMPRTRLERLICYADKFFSKGSGGNTEKSLERARASVARHSEEAGRRFDRLAAEFEPHPAAGGGAAI